MIDKLKSNNTKEIIIQLDKRISDLEYQIGVIQSFLNRANIYEAEKNIQRIRE